jgi:hypothetical protein
VTSFRKKAIDVYSQRTAAVQNRCSDPSLTTPLNPLLQTLLQSILVSAVLRPRFCRQKLEAANRRLDIS